MQGFSSPGKQPLLKELAVLSIDRPIPDSHLCTLLFEPPYPWKRLNNKYREKNEWLTRNFHGLKWESGIFEYSVMGSIICEILSDAMVVYTNGDIRKQWLEKILQKTIVSSIRSLWM